LTNFRCFSDCWSFTGRQVHTEKLAAGAPRNIIPLTFESESFACNEPLVLLDASKPAKGFKIFRTAPVRTVDHYLVSTGSVLTFSQFHLIGVCREPRLNHHFLAFSSGLELMKRSRKQFLLGPSSTGRALCRTWRSKILSSQSSKDFSFQNMCLCILFLGGCPHRA
jgi:hypothetical protein